MTSTRDLFEQDTTQDEQAPTDPTIAMIRRMQRLSEKRAAAEAAAAELETVDAPAAPAPIPDETTVSGSIAARMASIDRDLQRLEADGYFVSLPMQPQNEFPTLLSRLPIFRPSRRSHQQRLQDTDNAIAFSTPFGEGKRYGPPLTVRDEDTLIALMRLRSRRLEGQPTSFPVALPNIYETCKGNVNVHCVVCSLEQLVDEMGLKRGGSANKLTLESVKRLGATKLELNLTRHDKYLKTVINGRMFDLIHLQWQMFDDQGLLVVLFPPVIAQWLESQYTWLDWKVRRQLGDLGKALHRFLSSQPHQYSAEAVKIGETIGFDGPRKNIRPRFSEALDEMIDVGWLDAYEFTGNGRKTPLRLSILRSRSGQ